MTAIRTNTPAAQEAPAPLTPAANHANATAPADTYEPAGAGHPAQARFTLKNALIQVLRASSLVTRSAHTFVPSGYADSWGHRGETSPTTLYFTGPGNTTGSIVANLDEMWNSKHVNHYTADLAENYMTILSEACGIQQSKTKQPASVRIPGYAEYTYYVGVYVNGFNDTNGVKPTVQCIFDQAQNPLKK